MRAQDEIPLPFCMELRFPTYLVFPNNKSQEIYGLKQTSTSLKKGMSIFWNMFQGKTHRWHLGLAIHIKLMFIMLNMLFICVIINQYILLVYFTMWSEVAVSSKIQISLGISATLPAQMYINGSHRHVHTQGSIISL